MTHPTVRGEAEAVETTPPAESIKQGSQRWTRCTRRRAPPRSPCPVGRGGGDAATGMVLEGPQPPPRPGPRFRWRRGAGDATALVPGQSQRQHPTGLSDP